MRRAKLCTENQMTAAGTTLAAQLPNLLANDLYFNVHTRDYPGGEVCGQILLVPEPASIMLALCAVAWFACRRCR
jgi:CHRD domain